MFTAFSYYDPEEENRVRRDIKDSASFNAELKIAKKFADSKADTLTGKKKEYCPICNGVHISLFYEKWGVDYLRCDKCYSIFADVERTILQEYREFPDMLNHRITTEYQEKAMTNRKQIWDEVFDWLKFRTYRYLGKNKDLSVIDYGTRYHGLVQMLASSDLCKEYELRDSILDMQNDADVKVSEADVILCLDYIQQEIEPIYYLEKIKHNLKPNGLLFLSTRVGSGFDILTLREHNRNVFPYEHVMLPSKEGLKIMLEAAGFELLEITTPGSFDWNYVKSNRNYVSTKDYFLQYFMDTATPNMEAEFQRFLQQSGMSSYAQVVARLL